MRVAVLYPFARTTAAPPTKWTIAFWHHPPYSKGSHNSDTESNLVQMRQIFLPILEEAGVDLVLALQVRARSALKLY